MCFWEQDEQAPHHSAEDALCAPPSEQAAAACELLLFSVSFMPCVCEQVVVVGSAASAETKRMLDVVHEEFLPNKTVVLLDEANGLFYGDVRNDRRLFIGSRQFFERRCGERVKGMKMVDGKTTVYVCRNLSCTEPITQVEKLREALFA